MDSKIEQSNKQKVLRRAARLLVALGYNRTKPSFFTRERVHTIEFVHIHKFSYRPSFRVHVAIRVLNVDTDFIVLNGLSSDPYRPAERPNDKSYDLSFGIDESSLETCAQNIFDFVRDVGEPWFLNWNDPDTLINRSTSPLDDHDKAGLVEAVQGGVKASNVVKSRKLLGLE